MPVRPIGTDATRFCGTLRLDLWYRDRKHRPSYDALISDSSTLEVIMHVADIRLSAHRARTIAADSDQAFDEIARAAISFGAHEVPAVYDRADCDEHGNAIIRRLGRIT